MEACKKTWVEPKMEEVAFAANEYVAFCGQVDGEEDLWFVQNGVISEHTAWHREPAGQDANYEDDIYSDPRTIYEGSFWIEYPDGTMEPDSTSNHKYECQSDTTWDAIDCARPWESDVPGENGGSAWGWHYHFVQTSNHS